MNNQTKFLLKKGVFQIPAHVRTKSVLNDISNFPTQRDSKIQYKRRNAIVPVHVDSEIQKECLTSKPMKKLAVTQQIEYENEMNQNECLDDQNFKRMNFLPFHKFTQDEYQTLIDWIIGTIKRQQNLSLQTLFSCIELVDLFLSSTQNFVFDDLQLIGSSCIYLASKFNDLYPICIEDIVINICEEQYTIHDFLHMEQTILRKLNYNIHITTVYHIFEKYFTNLQPYLEQFYEKHEINNMKFNALELLQYSIINYEFRYISHLNKTIACIYQIIKKTDKRIIQKLLEQLNHIEINLKQIELFGNEIQKFLTMNQLRYYSVNNYFY